MRIIPRRNKTETYEVHNEETFRNLEASLATLKEIIEAQRAHIRNLEHERDLLAEGYRAAVEKCDELEASARDQVAQSNSTQKE